MDDYYNKYFIDWKRKLHELDDIMKESGKIIFHGEWLRDVIVDYFAEKKEMLNKKAIWIVIQRSFTVRLYIQMLTMGMIVP